ncbi:MAG: hypothetical protein J5802_02105 [Butyrivibrio sp.]|nr:hypothetical protein [Butyrivibrio sp.]
MKGRVSVIVTALVLGISVAFLNGDSSFSGAMAQEQEMGDAASGEMYQSAGGDIVNNGQFFVKVKDKLYFHVPSRINLDYTSWFGSFAQYDYGDNMLYSYDFETDKVSRIGLKASYGYIYVLEDRLFTNFFTGTGMDRKIKAIAYDLSRPEDGYPQELVKSDNICAVDKDGKLLVTSIYSDSGIGLTAYTNTGKSYDIDNVTDCIMCDSERVFYITEPDYYGVSQIGLWEFNTTDKQTTFLGYLPDGSNVGDYYSFKHLTEDPERGKLYFTMNYYSGTTNELSEAFFLSADLGTEESLVCEDSIHDNPVGEDGDDPTAFRIDKDGKMQKDAQGEPFTATCDSLGRLVWYDAKCQKHVVEANTNKHGAVRDETGVLKEDPEIIEYIDGKIYVMRNVLERAKMDDQGWRMAYKRKEVRIYAVDVNTGEETDLFTLVRK